MLRQKQEPEETESEVTKVRRKWGWFRERKLEVPYPIQSVQPEFVQAETDTVPAQLTALQRAIQRRKRCLRISNLGVGIGLSGFATMMFNLLLQGRPEVGSPGFGLQIGLIFGGEALVLTSILRGEKALREAAGTLASTEDLRAVGPLAEALCMGEPTYSLVVAALTRLLPRLQASDSPLLNETQRACLRRALKQSSNRRIFWRYNPHFANLLQNALATLDALPETESAEAVALPRQHPSNVETLLEQFQAIVRQRQKNALTIGASAVIGAVFALANVAMQSYVLLGLSLGCLGITLSLTFRGLFRLKALMNELANSGDLRVVGPLIEIAALQDSNANPIAALLLTRLLPRLQASDAALLTDAQRAALGRTLIRNGSNPDFLIAALKALEQIGDGSALAVVENLAAGKIKTADPKRVQAAAQACLPFLQTRYEQQQASQMLLRASHAFETPPDTLLRPAQGIVTTEDAELLRPGTPRPEIVEEETKQSERIERSAHPLDPFGVARGLSVCG